MESKPLENFLYGMRAQETRRKYVPVVEKFFDFLEFNGTIEQKAEDFMAKASGNNSWVSESLVKFITYQKSRAERGEIAEATVRNFFKPVKLFLEMNDINLTWKKISRGMPRGRRHASDRAPTLDEIRAIVKYPDRRIKAIVYTMCSSAIRLGAWDTMKWGDITPIEENGNVVAAKLLVYPGDEEEYITFMTQEAFGEIQQWMDFRASCGEKITKDSPVMRDLWNVEDGGRGFVRHPEKLKSSGVKRMMERALWSQGIRKKLEPGRRRHEFQTDHGFRKWFKSRAEQIIKPINVEVLMGHSTGISDSYYRPTEDELFRDYLKAVPLLSISLEAEARQELAVAEKGWTEQIGEMRERISSLESQVQVLTSSILVAKSRVRRA